MAHAPVTSVDLAAFAADPYPALAQMRRQAPITYVPELDAILFCRRDDIHRQEKRVHVFSSQQPDGLMTRLMGENMMRKDGEAHMNERRALFPALSPRTVAQHWKPMFESATRDILRDLIPKGKCDLVKDYAMPVSAAALKAITGLSRLSFEEMDRVSQHMIDGCANYTGDADVENRCHAATALIDAHIDQTLADPPAKSAVAVQQAAGLPLSSLRANVKLVISGGQNEPRDVIAGSVWALLSHPAQLAKIRNGQATWQDAFAEYARWQSPIGMSPRLVAQPDTIEGIQFQTGQRVFFMFSSASRDEAYFTNPDIFDITRDTSPAIPFRRRPAFLCRGGGLALSDHRNRAAFVVQSGPKFAAGWGCAFHRLGLSRPHQVPVAW